MRISPAQILPLPDPEEPEKTSSNSLLPQHIVSSIQITTSNSSSLIKRIISNDQERNVKQKTEGLKKEIIELDALLKDDPHVVDLLQDLATLFNNPSDYNVILNVDGQTFYAHREILAARSRMLKKLVLGFFKENEQSMIDLTPITSTQIFEKILFFLYTGQIELSLNDIPLIYVEADYLELEGLKELCFNTFIKNLTKKDAYSLLVAIFETIDAHPILNLFYHEVLAFCVSDERIIPNYCDLPERISNDIKLLNYAPCNIKNGRENVWFKLKLKETNCVIAYCGDKEATIFVKMNRANCNFCRFQLGNHEWELGFNCLNDYLAGWIEINSTKETGPQLEGTIVRAYAEVGTGVCFLDNEDVHKNISASFFDNKGNSLMISLRKISSALQSAFSNTLTKKAYQDRTIFLQINLNLKLRDQQCPFYSTSHCTNELTQSLIDLSKNCDEGDNSVAFQCEDTCFYAYTFFLKQRIPLFFNELTLQNKIYYPDVEKDFFKIFLQFIYTGKIALNTIEEGRALFLLGHQFNLPALRETCQNFCLSQLSKDNAFDLLKKIDRGLEEFLYKEIIKIIEINARTLFVKENQDFLDLNSSDFFNLLDSSNLNLREEDVIQATAFWLESKSNADQLKEEAKKKLRPTLIDLKNLWSIVAKIQVNGHPLFSPYELSKISLRIAGKKKIDNIRHNPFHWLIQDTDQLFTVQKEIYTEKETVAYWKTLLFPTRKPENKEILQTKNNHYELVCECSESDYIAFYVNKIYEKNVASITCCLLNKDESKIHAMEPLFSGVDTDNSHTKPPFPLINKEQLYREKPFKMDLLGAHLFSLKKDGFIFNDCLHIQVKVQEF